MPSPILHILKNSPRTDLNMQHDLAGRTPPNMPGMPSSLCKKRWWLLRVPLIDIAHRLGHRSVDTLIRNDLHIIPFMQKEFMPDDNKLYHDLRRSPANPVRSERKQR